MKGLDRDRVEIAVLEGTIMFMIFSLAYYVYANYGFDDPLYRDLSIYMYGGQRLVEGVPPYVSIFDHKGPLSYFLAGAGVWLGRLVGWGDIYGARAVFFAFGCLTVVAIYMLGRSVFSSRSVGILSALTFLGFYAYARPVASGPEPKTPMVLFEALSLFLMGQKRWFWAGLFGSLAFLAWQPMGLLPATCVLLALFQPRAERLSAALRALGGAALPLLLVFFYYLNQGAVRALLEGMLLFNVLYIDRHGEWVVRIFDPRLPDAIWRWTEVLDGYELSFVIIFVGLAFVASLVFARPFRYSYLPLLITLPTFVLWTAYDFQAREDFYIFLPHAAVGFGGLIALGLRAVGAPRPAAGLPAVVLLLVALVNTPGLGPGEGPGWGIPDQLDSIEELQERFGEDVRLVSINAPQSLVFLGRENPNRFLFTTDGIDQQIDADYPNGFRGWIESIEEYDPDVIAFFADGQRQMPDSGMDVYNIDVLWRWLEENYEREKIGNFYYYVEPRS